MLDRPERLREYRTKIVPIEDAPPPAPYPDHLGYRTKFGGTPEAIQPGGDDERTCEVCFQPLRFIAQIDSFGYGQPEAQFMFGDVGMIYVWSCLHCQTPSATTSSY